MAPARNVVSDTFLEISLQKRCKQNFEQVQRIVLLKSQRLAVGKPGSGGTSCGSAVAWQ